MSDILMNAEQMQAALEKLAGALIAKHQNHNDIAIIGIQRRGVILAARLGAILGRHFSANIPNGSLDITLYRDDWTTKSHHPAVLHTNIPFDVSGKKLILVDDVLYTGRTIRAALEAIADYGRPDKVELLVLVDRGHRELPIHADYTALSIETNRHDRVDVLVNEYDQVDEVRLVSK